MTSAPRARSCSARAAPGALSRRAPRWAPLLRWYDKNRRRLPWRERPTPYRTWISEIMLQQTQVSTVIPYYERFLKRFPDVRTLAEADPEDLLRSWAGLGYYSRARNLRLAAQKIVAEHGGRFPDAPEEVLALPGIGRYTMGAILSIAFGKPHPVLDGNVARVLSRLYGLRGDVKSGPMQKKLWGLAERLLEPSRPGDWNQALMELGATVCVPDSPHCDRCPLARRCVARREGLQEKLPESASRRKPIHVRWTCLWIEKSGRLLLWKRVETERFLPGHWGLPETHHLFASSRNGRGISGLGPKIAEVRHSITHHKITAAVHRADPPSRALPANARWAPIKNLREHLVSSIWTKAAAATLRAGPDGASTTSRS